MDKRYAPPRADVDARAKRASGNPGVYEYFAQPSGARVSLTGCLPAIISGAVAALLGVMDLTAYALPAAALTFGGLWWRNRDLGKRAQATLSIEGTQLCVEGP
ncbi:MAG TPA: hypothetical protein VGJ91_20120, partial [Polyangiaceae bacterium]